jgi:ABC-type proline/glycine betaine transport system permease subunit
MSFEKLTQFIIIKTIEHIELTFISILAASFIAIPFGIFLAKWKKKKISKFIIFLIQQFQTIPPLALIGLIMMFLILLKNLMNSLVIGVVPGILILFIFALMPILYHTFEGVKAVKSNEGKQVLKSALPTILEGIRVTTVLIVGVATLVSLVGSGGLGDLIFEGLKNLDITLILSGSLPAAFLGIALNGLVVKIRKLIL